MPNALFEIIYSAFYDAGDKMTINNVYLNFIYLSMRTQFVEHVSSETEQKQRHVNCYNRETIENLIV